MIAFLIALLTSLAFTVVSYLIQPKPKQPKPAAAKQAEAPTADAGKPVLVLFGTMTIKEGNVLWWGDKAHRQFQVKA